MGFLEMSDDQVAKYREQLQGYARERVTDPIVSAAMLRRGGAATRMGISSGQLGGIAYAASSLFSKKKAGGLPDKVFFVATPTELLAYKAKVKGRGWKLGDEVARWDRSAITASTEQKMGMTMLTIESPSEGERVTMAPIGVRDDPVSLELMQVLKDGVTDAPAG
jgi:hypothetical protein